MSASADATGRIPNTLATIHPANTRGLARHLWDVLEGRPTFPLEDLAWDDTRAVAVAFVHLEHHPRRDLIDVFTVARRLQRDVRIHHPGWEDRV